VMRIVLIASVIVCLEDGDLFYILSTANDAVNARKRSAALSVMAT